MSITAYKVEAVGHDRTGEDYGYVNIMYRYPADVDDNALRFFGPERYHSNEFQDEAYLFIPFDEDYYQAIRIRMPPLAKRGAIGLLERTATALCP